MAERKVDILGTVYTIKEQMEGENELLKGCDGYCDWTTKEIVVNSNIDGDVGDMAAYARKVIRHEIVHAFFIESGLDASAGQADSWARNESVVDWFARQGQKIHEAWGKVGALDGCFEAVSVLRWQALS